MNLRTLAPLHRRTFELSHRRTVAPSNLRTVEPFRRRTLAPSHLRPFDYAQVALSIVERRTAAPFLVCLVILLSSIANASAATTIRVGVFTLFKPTELDVRPAPGQILLIHTERERLRLEGAQTARVWLAGRMVTVAHDDQTLSGEVIHITARDGTAAEFSLSVPDRINRVFQGRLEVTAVDRALAPVVTVDLEQATAAAVAGETRHRGVVTALEAQAVVARSYYAAQSNRHRHFDFCDTTHCQYLADAPGARSKIARAVATTRGMVLAHAGRPLAAQFSASCGGRTRTLHDIGVTARDYPYYAVTCEPCLRDAPTWERRLSLDSPYLLHRGSEVSRLIAGRVNGWNFIPSNNYRLSRENDAVILQGRGAGHGLGLCQLGAMGFAARGADMREILRHYFPNTSLQILRMSR